MLGFRELALRAVVPTLAAGVLEHRLTSQVLTRTSRALHRPVRAEFYFAFDDPYSALCFHRVLALARRERFELEVYPVLRRGVSGDSVAELRNRYAVIDARRMARDFDQGIARESPVAAERVAVLTAWAEAARHKGHLNEFCQQALDAIWGDQDMPDFGQLFTLYHRTVGQAPPQDTMVWRAHVRRNERRLRERGHWDTPSVRVGGKWFFAHERMEQLEAFAADMGAS